MSSDWAYIDALCFKHSYSGTFPLDELKDVPSSDILEMPSESFQTWSEVFWKNQSASGIIQVPPGCTVPGRLQKNPEKPLFFVPNAQMIRCCGIMVWFAGTKIHLFFRSKHRTRIHQPTRFPIQQPKNDSQATTKPGAQQHSTIVAFFGESFRLGLSGLDLPPSPQTLPASLGHCADCCADFAPWGGLEKDGIWWDDLSYFLWIRKLDRAALTRYKLIYVDKNPFFLLAQKRVHTVERWNPAKQQCLFRERP